MVARTTDEVAEVVERTIIAHEGRVRRARTPGGTTVARVAEGPSLQATRWHSPTRYETTTQPFHYLLLGHITQGRYEIGVPGDVHRFQRGDAVLLPTGVPLDVSWEDPKLATLALPLDRVREVAEERYGLPPGELRFCGLAPVDAAAARYWLDVFALANRQMLDGGSALGHPVLAEEMVRHLAVAALATFPNTTMSLSPSREPLGSAPAAVRRATAFIEEHAGEPVTAAQIAAAAGIGVRALQYAFARHHSATPSEYLRRVRLERAHRELLEAQPGDGRTVAAVAARWGFPRPGRFASHYRAVYGRSPSETLRS
nr:helix-turn-helix transcriptional regulator [Auraticoccus cholistanensis]